MQDTEPLHMEMLLALEALLGFIFHHKIIGVG